MNRATQSKVLNYSAYLPELLSVALTVKYGWALGSSGIMAWIIVFGFSSFVVFRAIAVPASVASIKSGQYADSIPFLMLTLMTVAILLSTSYFDLIRTGDEGVSSRIEASKPAEALDAQIKTARERLNALAGYADANRARDEERAASDIATRAKEQYKSTQREISLVLDATPKNSRGKSAGKTLGELTGDCFGYKGYYSSRCQDVERMRRDASNLDSASTARPAQYATRHAEYNGVSEHMNALLTRRAEMSESGHGVSQAYPAEDRFIAEQLGISPERAASLKYLIFALLFDLVALLARIGSEVLSPDDKSAGARKRLSAMLELGIDPTESGGEMLPAGVSRDGIPSLDSGGKITGDGLAIVHKGERVLTVAETERYEAETVSRLDEKPSKREPGRLTESRSTDAFGTENPSKRDAVERACENCRTDMSGRRKGARFCGDECRAEAWKRNNGATFRKKKPTKK